MDKVAVEVRARWQTAKQLGQIDGVALGVVVVGDNVVDAELQGARVDHEGIAASVTGHGIGTLTTIKQVAAPAAIYRIRTTAAV
ncbi:hypothetical protein D9M68_616090 [compost metagenome]